MKNLYITTEPIVGDKHFAHTNSNITNNLIYFYAIDEEKNYENYYATFKTSEEWIAAEEAAEKFVVFPDNSNEFMASLGRIYDPCEAYKLFENRTDYQIYDATLRKCDSTEYTIIWCDDTDMEVDHAA